MKTFFIFLTSFVLLLAVNYSFINYDQFIYIGLMTFLTVLAAYIIALMSIPKRNNEGMRTFENFNYTKNILINIVVFTLLAIQIYYSKLAGNLNDVLFIGLNVLILTVANVLFVSSEIKQSQKV